MAKTKKKGPAPKKKQSMTRDERYARAKKDVLGTKNNSSLSAKENEKSRFWHNFFVILIAIFAAEAVQMIYNLSWGITIALAVGFIFVSELFVTKVLKK